MDVIVSEVGSCLVNGYASGQEVRNVCSELTRAYYRLLSVRVFSTAHRTRVEHVGIALY